MKAQVRDRIDAIMKGLLMGSLASMAILVLWASLSGCKPAGQAPKPLKTAVQPAPSPTPVDLGCWTVGQPVAQDCLDGGAPRCATEDGNDGAGRECWWVDPTDGRVWYRP